MAAGSADLDQMSRSVASYLPNSGSLTLCLPGTACFCFFVCLFGGCGLGAAVVVFILSFVVVYCCFCVCFPKN